ncbi:MAG: hypothetical protein EOO41_05255, partial [Methanobacteriota archaeon]
MEARLAELQSMAAEREAAYKEKRSKLEAECSMLNTRLRDAGDELEILRGNASEIARLTSANAKLTERLHETGALRDTITSLQATVDRQELRMKDLERSAARADELRATVHALKEEVRDGEARVQALANSLKQEEAEGK